MKTRLTRSRCSSTCWSLSTARIWPTISPALRLRFSPSSAVMQKAHSTAQPTWLETQMVARCERSPSCGSFEFRVSVDRSPSTIAGASETRLRCRVPADFAEPMLSAECLLPQFGIAILGAIAGFSAVAVGHPHRLDTLAVGECQQVTHGAVGGNKLLLDSGQTDRITRLAQSLPKGKRQHGELLQRRPPLPVQTVKKLAGAVAGLDRNLQQSP